MSVLIFITLKRSSREALSLTSKSSNTKAVSECRSRSQLVRRKEITSAIIIVTLAETKYEWSHWTYAHGICIHILNIIFQ